MPKKRNEKSELFPGIKDILSLADEKVFKAGESIFDEGSDDPNFYIIIKGGVLLTKKTSEGKPKTIAQVGEGDFLGEGVLFGSIKKPASAEAITDVTTLLVPSDRFERLIKDDPAAAVNFLLYVIELANNRLTKANTKLLALYETNQIMHMYRDDLNKLAVSLVDKLKTITDSNEGILLVKNSFSNTYRVIHSSSPDLNEHAFDKFSLDKDQKAEDENGQYLIVNLDGLGALALKRDTGRPHYDEDQLRFLMLISEQIAGIIRDASEKASEKAKKMLERKHFEV